MSYVYILETSSRKYYVGSTKNLKTRLEQHQRGSTLTTKRLGFVALVFSQKYVTLAEARYIERRLKKLKRRDYIEKIIKDGFIRILPP